MIYVILLLLVALLAAPLLFEARRKPMDSAARNNTDYAYVTLSDGITAYRWSGPLRGPVAVCVHGLTTPSFVWGGIAEGLAALGYRVLVYDHFGRGFSDRPKGLQDAAFFNRQLEELLADQKVDDEITLIGYSMGGAVATSFAAAHPERIRQLVLIAPAGLGISKTRLTRLISDTPLIGDWLMLALFPARHRAGCEAERALPSTVPDIVDLQLNELHYKGFVPAVLSSLRGILAHPLKPEHEALQDARVPVLAVWGREDDVVPIRCMSQLVQWNRTARQEVIDGAGHGLVYTDTAAVLDAMRASLRDGLA